MGSNKNRRHSDALFSTDTRQLWLYMVFLGLATCMSSLCSVLARPHHTAGFSKDQQGSLSAQEGRRTHMGQRGGEALRTPTIKSRCGVSTFQADPHHPNWGPAKCVGAVSSSCPFYPSSVSLGAEPASMCRSCSLLQPSGP